MLCKNTFNRFIDEYGQFVKSVDNNVYAISKNSSIDYETYKNIFSYDGIRYTEFSSSNLNNVSGCINTDEMYIDFGRVTEYFDNLLKDIIVKRHIYSFDELSGYDIILNCTNNFIRNPVIDSFYELTLSLVYKSISPIEFGALTVVDGPFLSIFPYKSDLYTMTDVEHTPMFISNDINEIQKFYNSISSELILDKRKLMEEKVSSYYTEFLNKFEYNDYYLSVKSKFNSNSSDRYPVISKTDNVIHCFTGKIQGIYPILDSISKILST